MSNNFILFFLLSLLFSGLIFSLTVFLAYLPKTKQYLWSVTAFGSGVLLSLIVFDFLPHALESDKLSSTLIFILLGFAVNAFSEMVWLPRVKFLNRFWPKSPDLCHEKEHIHYHFMPSATGCSALACLMLCAFFDGLRLASATLLDLETAIIMGFGLLFHLIPESVTVISIGLSAGFSKKTLLKISLLFCASFLLGYQALFVLSLMEVLKTAILPFAGGLFLYVSCIHLIPMIFKLKLLKPFFIGMIFCFAMWFCAKLI